MIIDNLSDLQSFLKIKKENCFEYIAPVSANVNLIAIKSPISKSS
jgi:hypothetical protein